MKQWSSALCRARAKTLLGMKACPSMSSSKDLCICLKFWSGKKCFRNASPSKRENTSMNWSPSCKNKGLSSSRMTELSSSRPEKLCRSWFARSRGPPLTLTMRFWSSRWPLLSREMSSMLTSPRMCSGWRRLCSSKANWCSMNPVINHQSAMQRVPSSHKTCLQEMAQHTSVCTKTTLVIRVRRN